MSSNHGNIDVRLTNIEELLSSPSWEQQQQQINYAYSSFSKIIWFALCHIWLPFYTSCMPVGMLWSAKKERRRRMTRNRETKKQRPSQKKINDRHRVTESCTQTHTHTHTHTHRSLSIIVYLRKTACVYVCVCAWVEKINRVFSSLSNHQLAHLAFCLQSVEWHRKSIFPDESVRMIR